MPFAIAIQALYPVVVEFVSLKKKNLLNKEDNCYYSTQHYVNFDRTTTTKYSNGKEDLSQ